MSSLLQAAAGLGDLLTSPTTTRPTTEVPLRISPTTQTFRTTEPLPRAVALPLQARPSQAALLEAAASLLGTTTVRPAGSVSNARQLNDINFRSTQHRDLLRLLNGFFAGTIARQQ